ncbi:MAG: hypothetical protein NTY66_03140, partial [Candidatus Vogelbacteria bacterium]|nr:hypothetical protein [Candidatus Vogelbacteria bacterium]
MLTRLLNRDGSLDMSFYDLNTTLPNLCRAMGEIQESYTNETDREVARRAGVLDASGKVHSLKKFVMTQGSVEAILSAWKIEKQTQKTDRSFSEFLDERFKTALTFEEYSKEDRILAAKILASRGFLLTLDAKELGLPEDIFTLNTIKAMRGEEAVADLKEQSGKIKHLTLKEVALLDPFDKRLESIRKQAEGLLSEGSGETDPFLSVLEKRRRKLFGLEKREESILSATYTYRDPQTGQPGTPETITLDIEQKLTEFTALYQQTNINLPPDFEETVKDIWDRNQTEITQAIEEQGFNELLLIPGHLSLPDLAEKMKMANGNYESDNFKAGGSFAGAQSQNTDQPRLVLVHRAQNLKDRPELKATLNIKGEDVYLANTPTLADYLIFQRKYFAETGHHLDEDGWTWLATHSGTRLVYAYWGPADGRLYVGAGSPADRVGYLGARPSRSFF